jgi:hypothetical protein
MPTPVPISAYFYNLAQTLPVTDYGAQLENLKLTTIAPGGFGDFTCDLYVPSTQIPNQNFASFNNVALNCAGTWIFLGRLDEPGVDLDKTYGPVLHLSALGASDVLKDDPQDTAYTSQTWLQIITDQLSGPTGASHPRSNYLPLSTDTSLILPDNPASTYSPEFNALTIEDILNQGCNDLGDYTWAVWNHLQQIDAQGFPKWQLQVHARNFGLTTPSINYRVTQEQIIDFDIRPAVEYSFNSIYLVYRDPTTQNPGAVQVQDSRLNSNRSQGTAPFPFRLMRKDVSDALLTATQATTLANALLNQYKNGSYKITMTLGAISDNNGSPIPLATVRADNNVFVDLLTPLGPTLPTGITKDAGLFYITETEYTETKGETPQLVLTCDTFYDSSAFQLARIQRPVKQTLGAKTKGSLLQPGIAETGQVGTSWGGNALSTDTYEEGVNFKSTLNSAPASITLTATSTSNANTPTAANIQTTGFEFKVTPTANGAGRWYGSYKGVGT